MKIPCKKATLIFLASSKTKARKDIHEKLENGEINILIGTHALLEDKVQISNKELNDK